jgi:hypothetical protein
MWVMAKRNSEKYMKRLIGRTDMENALKRLDKWTQEEARMAVAQNLKATHAVDERVREVANMVVATDNRVTGVDDRVAGVDNRLARVDDRVAGVDDGVARVNDRVASIDGRVAGVDDRVRVVDDKVAEVIHGAQIIFGQFSPECKLSSGLLRRKGSKPCHATSSQRSRSNEALVVPNLVIAD